MDGRCFGRAPAGFAGIGKEGHRRLGADEDQFFDFSESLDDLLREIGNALDHDEARTTLDARRKGVAHDARAGRRSDTARRDETALLQRGTANDDGGLLAGLKRLGRDVHGGLRHRCWAGDRQGIGGAVRFKPSCVGGQDQRRDLTGRLHGGLHGTRAIGGDRLGAGA